MMKQRSLGQQGLSVSTLGYGAMGINSAYGPTDVAEGIEAIRCACDLGVTFFDTAELYGWGENPGASRQGFPGRGRHRHQVRLDDRHGS